MHVQLLIAVMRHPRIGHAMVLRASLWTVAVLYAATRAWPCMAGETLEEGYAAVLHAMDRLSGPDHAWHDRGNQVEYTFQAHVLPHARALPALSTQDLRLLLRAIHATTRATRQPDHSGLAMRVGLQLRARGALLAADMREGAAIAVISRDRSALKPSSPWAPAFGGHPLPQMPEAVQRFEYWMPSPDGAAYSSGVADMASLDIVVIAHPACGFTRAVADAARVDPQLLQMPSGVRSLWLSPQDGTLDTRIFTNWSKRHPDLPIRIAARQSAFPAFDYWGTPTFYVLRDGEVAARVVGWPRDGNKTALVQAFAKAGIRIAGPP